MAEYNQWSEFLDGIVGVVDANSFEKLSLWRENEYGTTTTKRTWVENSLGYLPTVGWVNGDPVCLSIQTAVIGGHKLLFINPTSQVVDYRMVDKWLEDHVPVTALNDRGYVNRTDAMNFCNVFPRELEKIHA